jgi:outer membrane protein
LTAQYHFKGLGAFKPYIGAGGAYAVIFNSPDGAIQKLNVDGAPAFVAQVGFDYALNQTWGLFVDAKKLFLSVNADGLLGAPATAKVKLDPLVVSGGVVYRF